MESTVLDRTRAHHEDIELFERAVVEVMIDEPKTAKDNVYTSHYVNVFTEKIMDRCKKLMDIYDDNDGSRQKEISSIVGQGQALYHIFYDKLREIKEYHRKYPNLQPEKSEAEQMLNSFDIETVVQFSGEEGYGKYLDLHEFFDRFINLKGVNKDIYYVQYLDIFYEFPDKNTVKDQVYLDYLKDLWAYLVSFFKRSQPLFDISAPLKQFEDDLNSSWNEGKFTPIGWTEEEDKKLKDQLFCKECNKSFTKDTVFEHHFKGQKHIKAAEAYKERMKEIWFLEVKINRLMGLLNDQLEDTKGYIEKKQARNENERLKETEENQDVDESSSDTSEEEVRMTKVNYPVGWDGNPIPYWLYKLHGLGIEYKCEICGNTSYWGRRAFEKHFQEWRHAHGMKCLRIENTKAFHEVTRIQDALELDRHLRKNSNKDKWDPDNMEEYEDEDGHVLNRKTYLDLKKQGIL